MTAEPVPTAPQDLEAERYILAALLLDPAAAKRLVASNPPILARSDFYSASHQHIFAAIRAVTERGITADLITTTHELAAQGNLQIVGGPITVSQLADYATTSANLDQHCAIVRELSVRRRALALSEALHSGASSRGVNLSDLLASVGQQAASIATGIEVVRPATLLDQVETVEEAIERGVPPVESLIGTGLVVAGGITLIASLPKFGKTFLALQAQRSLAQAAPWLGFQAREARSLMLQLEMPLAGMLDRFRASLPDCRGRIDLLVQPTGWDSLTSPRIIDDLCRTIDARRVELVVADPVRALHTADENSGQDQGGLMDAIRLVCRRTGVAFALLHHVNKLVIDKNTDLRTGVLLAVRGSTRYVSDADTIMGLVRVHGQTRLVFAGARFGAFPESIAVKQDEHGWFSVIDTPEQQRDATEEAVEKFLMASGASGMTVRDLMRATSKSEGTVRRALANFHVASAREPGKNGALRFYLPGCEPSENVEMGDAWEDPQPDSGAF